MVGAIGCLLSGVIKRGWIENPRTQWKFIAGKFIELSGGFSIATFDCRMLMGD
jgi:hypothetical protein